MKKLGAIFVCISTSLILLVFTARTAQSRPQYSKEFIAKYVKLDSQDVSDKAFSEAVNQAKCTVCHESDSKKNRNAFGRELAKLLHNEKDPTKIDAAFDEVLKMHCDPKNPSSPTYGELIKQGKLPCSE